jgi:peroxiredoxin
VRSRRSATLALVALVVAATLGPPAPARSAPAAPGFRVRVLDSSREIDSRELTGKKILVLRFQASYCRPCVKESAAFNRLLDRYRERPVEFLAVHVQDTVADTRRFIRAQKATYPVAVDPKLAIGNAFGFKGTPYTVVVDLNGEMVAQIHGESAVRALPRIIDEALARAPKSE